MINKLAIRNSILVACMGLMATAPAFAANKEQQRLETPEP